MTQNLILYKFNKHIWWLFILFLIFITFQPIPSITIKAEILDPFKVQNLTDNL